MAGLDKTQATDSLDTVEEMIEPAVPERIRWMTDMLDPQPGERIADLGCGTGDALEAIAGRVDAEVIGLDFSAAVLRTAAAALDRLPGVRLVLAQADLTDPVPLADASVDRVLCHNVLECLSRPAALVAESHRILRPGGRLVLSHSDFDTLLFASEDLELTRRLVRSYCDTQQDWMEAVDGTIGRRLVDIVGQSPMVITDVQARVNVSRRFEPGELGYAYAHNLARTLQVQRCSRSG